MNSICGDNRFEIIAKAKKDLLESTNIECSEDEMKVLDNFLFRCWQMGWLDRYEEKIEEDTVDRVERIMAERRKLFGNQNPCKDIIEMIIGVETE